jgi:hypothetical protein
MRKQIHFFSALGAAVLLAVSTAQAEKVSEAPNDYVSRYEPVLKAVKSIELPARAASLVRQAEPKARKPIAIAVIRVISKINPAAIPSVVGAISRAEPTIAVAVSTEASRLQPKLAYDIKIASAGSSSPPNPLPDPTPTDGSRRVSALPDPEPTPGRDQAVQPSPNPLPDPTPTDGSSRLSSLPDPEPTPGRGKKKGHYKNP